MKKTMELFGLGALLFSATLFAGQACDQQTQTPTPTPDLAMAPDLAMPPPDMAVPRVTKVTSGFEQPESMRAMRGTSRTCRWLRAHS
mgnify:CR=1 FL=1